MAVEVIEGQHVRRGQTLFIIDRVPYEAALRTAEANLNAARANEANARLELEGKQQLFKKSIISAYELQRAENTLFSAEAAVAQAMAGVTDARNNLSYTTVTSPCDGVTGTIPYRQGFLAGPDMTQPLTTVSDNKEMYVYFSLPENRLTELARTYGSADAVLSAMPPVTLYLNDGSRYEHEGRIESISGVLDPVTGSSQIRAVFPNYDGLLRSGGAGTVGLSKSFADVVTLPQSATYELQDKVYAFKVSNGTAIATRIDVQPVAEQRIYVVRGGIAEGDTIITEGVGTLRDGANVRACLIIKDKRI